MSFKKDSKDYRYSQRSCTNCTSECQFEKNRNHNREWLDNGKCGCRSYTGDFEDELTKLQIKRIAKLNAIENDTNTLESAV